MAEGHRTIDIVLACHAGDQGLNPGQNQGGFFLFGKIHNMCSYPLRYPTMAIPL